MATFDWSELAEIKVMGEVDSSLIEYNSGSMFYDIKSSIEYSDLEETEKSKDLQDFVARFRDGIDKDAINAALFTLNAYHNQKKLAFDASDSLRRSRPADSTVIQGGTGQLRDLLAFSRRVARGRSTSVVRYPHDSPGVLASGGAARGGVRHSESNGALPGPPDLARWRPGVAGRR